MIYDSGHDDNALYFDPETKYGSHAKVRSLRKPGSSRASSGQGRKFENGDVYGKTEVRRGMAGKGRITQSG